MSLFTLYLEHLSEGSIPQFSHNLPDFLRICVPVHMIILFLLLLCAQFKDFSEIKEGHSQIPRVSLFLWSVDKNIFLSANV